MTLSLCVTALISVCLCTLFQHLACLLLCAHSFPLPYLFHYLLLYSSGPFPVLFWSFFVLCWFFSCDLLVLFSCSVDPSLVLFLSFSCAQLVLFLCIDCPLMLRLSFSCTHVVLFLCSGSPHVLCWSFSCALLVLFLCFVGPFLVLRLLFSCVLLALFLCSASPFLVFC